MLQAPPDQDDEANDLRNFPQLLQAKLFLLSLTSRGTFCNDMAKELPDKA